MCDTKLKPIIEDVKKQDGSQNKESLAKISSIQGTLQNLEKIMYQQSGQLQIACGVKGGIS